jgi:adenosyl cobinamide kinase/adenosyl cobinamide phosphate guanylyltransferase
MISEIKEHHIDLKRPKIVCDQLLDPTGKQLQEPLPNTNHTMLFLGKPKSGKSSLAFSLISSKNKAYYKLFSKVFLIIPPSSLSSLNIPMIKHHKRLYPELSSETLEDIDEETEELNEKGKDHHSLILFDDVGSVIKSDRALEETLKKFSWNYRHRCRSQWYLLQTYRSLSLGIRKVATHLVIFKLAQLELELIQNELILFLNKSQWLDVCRHVFDSKYGKHTAIFCDLESQKLFRLTDNKFYELKIE